MTTKEERINSMPTLEEVTDRLLTPEEKMEVQNLAKAMTVEMRSPNKHGSPWIYPWGKGV
jgi:hypothetical protein